LEPVLMMPSPIESSIVLPLTSTGLALQAVAFMRSDDPRNAIETMRDAMNTAEKINAVFLRPLHLGHLGTAYMSIGQPEVGLDLRTSDPNSAGIRRAVFRGGAASAKGRGAKRNRARARGRGRAPMRADDRTPAGSAAVGAARQVSHASGATSASAPKPANFLPRSTVGSLKALTRPI
jgi:hypothetical protein